MRCVYKITESMQSSTFLLYYYHEVIGLNSTNLTVENGRDKCVHCVWEDAGKGVSRGFSSSCMLQGAYVGSSNDGDGGGGSFAAIELIGHLLFPVPPLRKSMFRKSMGSGDNGKPHKARTRRGHGNGPSQGSRTVLYMVYRPSSSSARKVNGGVCVSSSLSSTCSNDRS